MYLIKRFYAPGSKKDDYVVKTVATLEEAREWCSRDDTHGNDWFDGYQEI